MNIKEIQDIINFIKKTDLDDVSIETENYKIRVKKNNSEVTQLKEKKNIPVEIENDETKLTEESEIETNHITIKSPMIGTLYLSPNPESEPYINEGDTINAGQTICIIEAMKLFNEIESEFSGKVIKILIDDTSPVEFDQPLFIINPS
ncbi:MAG TPA: acetyl-CoA carboxylase biotin carboxyl carrier protein [Cytophagales bacterium]|jgi:acetyl-CoA carboxylase biotin carboxyl carrier protein|nr:acetyl-CoA carboxylase biotin carboxyl carrier protein [Cytophagales bacterium]